MCNPCTPALPSGSSSFGNKIVAYSSGAVLSVWKRLLRVPARTMSFVLSNLRTRVTTSSGQRANGPGPRSDTAARLDGSASVGYTRRVQKKQKCAATTRCPRVRATQRGERTACVRAAAAFSRLNCVASRVPPRARCKRLPLRAAPVAPIYFVLEARSNGRTSPATLVVRGAFPAQKQAKLLLLDA